MKRACIGDDKPHPASKAKALQVGPVTIEGARVVAADNAMANQERVKRAACLEAKNLLQFGTGQMLEPKLVERKRLEGAPLHLGHRSETRCELVRDAEGQVHGLVLPWNERSAQEDKSIRRISRSRAHCGSVEIVQERFRRLQIDAVEPLGEPVVDGLEQFRPLTGSALIAQQPREARGGA
jgi:hypothetical protein